MKKHFTLSELVVVIAIVAILSTILLPNILNFKSNSITATINSNIHILQTAVDIYKVENNKYPTVNDPELGNPQLIIFSELYPKYIKSLPNENKIPNQNYWVDYMGRVWGATVDSPSDLYGAEGKLEWSYGEDVVGYNIYEVKEKTRGALNHTIRLKEEITLTSVADKIQAEVDQSGNYLISAIDRYGLESAPVNMNYTGLTSSKNPFQPLIMEEGIFYFEINSEEVLYWDKFRTLEDKPEGTSISYSFAVSNDKNDLDNYVDDFYSLPPAKNIRVKITMQSYNGKYPSLYDIRIFYHYENEIILTSKKKTQSGNQIIYEYELGSQEYVQRIHYPSLTEPKENYRVHYSTDGVNYYPAPTLSEIPAGSYIKIIKENEDQSNLGSGSGGGTEEEQEPKIIAQPKKPIVYTHRNSGVNQEEEVRDPRIDEEGWETIQTLVFYATSTDGQITHWIRAEIEDVQPENTRILYFYATSNGLWFTQNVDSISKVSDSKILRVSVYLQIKEDYLDQEEKPTLNSIRIIHSKGVTDLDLVKPTGTIILNKSNNEGREDISTDSIITWDYVAFDPQDKEIIDVVWGGDKRERYETPGTYTVTLKLKNELNYWSNEIKYTFEVKDEKPVARLLPEGDVFSSYVPIEWDTKTSYDPDNDGIVNVEWGGEYRSDNIYPVGTHTITMRVQDAEGNWSDWISKTFTTTDSIFYNAPPLSIDMNQSSYENVEGIIHINWIGDLTNKTVNIRWKANSSGYGKIMIVDRDGNPLSFINATTGNIVTQINASTTTRTDSIVIPKNAHAIVLNTAHATVENTQFRKVLLIEITLNDDTNTPNNVENVTHTSTPSSITINWTKDATVSKVYIYRNGTYIGSSTTNTYKDTPLYSDTEYTYTLISFNSNNVSAGYTFTATTTSHEVTFRGLDAEAFDDSLNTSVLIAGGNTAYVTWDKNLENKAVHIRARASLSGRAQIEVRDINGDALDFININTGKVVKEVPIGSSSTSYYILIPKDAYAIALIAQPNHNLFIEDVSTQNINSEVHDVTNVTTTPNHSRMTINWTKGADISKVYVYRNGEYVGSSTTNSFTDTTLSVDTTYTYNLIAFNADNHASNGYTFTAATTRPDIVFHGLDAAAFDDLTNTGVTFSDVKTVTWEGDLIGKTISISWQTNSTGYGTVDIRNAEGEILWQSTAGNASRVGTLTVIVPEGATSITFTPRTGGYTLTVYDISVKN